MCDCIQVFNKQLKEATGDPEASVILSFRVKVASGELSEGVSMSCSYREKKKDGSFKNPKEHPISGEYCPFCGKHYADKSEVKQ